MNPLEPKVRTQAVLPDCFYEVTFRGSRICTIRYYPDHASPRSFERAWDQIPIHHQIFILQTIEKAQ